MAIEAVAYVVIQKLTDMLSDESIIGQKLIVDQLQEIKKALEKMRGYFIDAESKQNDDESHETIKKWADGYLQNLYYVEDAIETFALRIALQRKRLGFLMNHALFLKNFTAFKKLNRKMKNIQTKIELLNRDRPSGVEDASVRATGSQYDGIDQQITVYNGNKNIAEGEEYDDHDGVEDGEEVEDMFDDIAHPSDSFKWSPKRDVIEKQNTSLISEIHSAKFSNHELVIRSLSDNSISRDRLLQTRLMSSYSYDEDELEIVGFKKDIHDLVRKLTKQGRGAPRIISIYGEMGSGKTTLVRAVWATKKIKDFFKSCWAWVTILKESTTEEILLNLLKQIGNSKDQGSLISEQSLKTRLVERLSEKRYLIVLDDVWSLDMWEKLRDAFPDHRNGSKIILITCHKHLAVGANKGNRPVNVQRLSNQDSWDLFLKKAAVEKGPEHLRERILQICDGLPLNIVLLGSLLSTKKQNGYDQWPDVLSRQPTWHTLDIVALSYNDLPDDLKLCMLYVVLFPKESDIPIRRLLRLWLAEGFVKRPDKDNIFPEDVVEEYFDNLFKRSLIQISKQRSDGGHRSCRILGVLHEYLFPKALDIKLFHFHVNSDFPQPSASFGARRLVEYVDSKKCSFDSSQLKFLRSYLSFNFQKKDTPAKEVGRLLSSMISNGFRLLRVLDLEGVYKPSLPENLGNFFHLRYLGLRWTFLDTLPSSVGELNYLETLDIKHTYVNKLPSSVWKLKHLRHLNLNDMRLDMPAALPSSLPWLLTLCGLSIVDHECLVKEGLNRLLHLRELDITFHLRNSEDLLDWVSKLTALQQLRLRSKDDSGRPSTLSLKPLSNLGKLSHMNLLGNLPKLLAKDEFPQNIKVLTLSVSQLKEDPMPTLGQLRQLTVLRLLANSYLGEKIVCPQGGFPELRVLKLWMLKNLKEWDLGEGAMEKLKELNIRCCSKLNSIPSTLLLQSAFRELILTNMPRKFAEQVEKRKSRHVSLTVKDYKFTPLPWEQDDNSIYGLHSVAANLNGGSSSG